MSLRAISHDIFCLHWLLICFLFKKKKPKFLKQQDYRSHILTSCAHLFMIFYHLLLILVYIFNINMFSLYNMSVKTFQTRYNPTVVFFFFVCFLKMEIRMLEQEFEGEKSTVFMRCRISIHGFNFVSDKLPDVFGNNVRLFFKIEVINNSNEIFCRKQVKNEFQVIRWPATVIEYVLMF